MSPGRATRRVWILLLLAGTPAAASAQDPPAAPCEASGPYRDFDFWLGDWNVRLPDGRLAGTNRIERADAGCVLVERWSGSTGSTGTSLNLYHPGAAAWTQLWMGSDGGVIEIAGGLVDGAMFLEGTLTNPDGTAQPFRGRWTPNPDGSVRQHFEISADGGRSWTTWFDGRYTRR